MNGPEEAARFVAAAHAYEREFLPPGVRSSHAVLYDFEGAVEYVPTAARLAEALDGFRFLLDAIDAPAPEVHLWLRGLLPASELALGLAGRAYEAGVRLDPEILEPTRARARALHDACLTATPRYRTVDGVKRVGRLADLLERLSEPAAPGG